MPRRADILPFPGQPGLVLTADEHRLLTDVLRNFHGPDVEDILQRAQQVPGGVRLSDHGLEALLDAVGIEVMGFFKLDEERAGRALAKPSRGGTAARLQAIYDKIERHLS